MSYPACLSYTAEKLSNVSSQIRLIRPLGNESAAAGQVTSFLLPQNTLVDFRELQVKGRANTFSSTGVENPDQFVVLPRHTETLIDSLTVYRLLYR